MLRDMTKHLDASAAGKDHYLILDGLRGVAAVMVVLFHICEAYKPEHPLTQLINHGYLAVDFFFLLSGFVIAYAYDDRWQAMGLRDFFKRRLIRLQPMVVMGMVVGAALYYLQAGPAFPLIDATPVWLMLLVMLIGCTLLPLPPSMDIRGWGEMHPVAGNDTAEGRNQNRRVLVVVMGEGSAPVRERSNIGELATRPGIAGAAPPGTLPTVRVVEPLRPASPEHAGAATKQMPAGIPLGTTSATAVPASDGQAGAVSAAARRIRAVP